MMWLRSTASLEVTITKKSPYFPYLYQQVYKLKYGQAVVSKAMENSI